VLALCAALFASSVSITNVFPYSPFMVKHFGLTDDDERIGYYAGYFATAYSLGSMLASYPLGLLADRRGRRFVIEFGLFFSCVVPQLAFGMAPSFSAALALRFIGGLTNGVVAAAKAAAPELVSASENAWCARAIEAAGGSANCLAWSPLSLVQAM